MKKKAEIAIIYIIIKHLNMKNLLPTDTLDKLINLKADKFADDIFLIFNDRKFTYSNINSKISNAADTLKNITNVSNKFIALICGNTPEFVVAYFAILRAGAKVVPINPRLGKEELKHILQETQADIIIHPKSLNIKISGDKIPLLIEDVISLEITKLKLPVKKIGLKTDASNTAACIFTSGTTGKPKGALLSHKAIMHNARMCVDGLESQEKIECFVGVLPLFHAFSASACLMQTIFTGGRLLLIEQFQPLDVLKQMRKHKATVFLGVPAMYAMMAKVENPPCLDNLRQCISGGAPLPDTVFNAFYKKFNIKICEGDGPTECGPATSINPLSGKIKVGTIGLPLCDVEMKIVDMNEIEKPNNEVGEIIVKSPSNFSGYLNQPDETAKTLKNGWVFTGDLGFKDDDGYFTIVGRKKDMLLVGGLNVYPTEIEEYLRMHPQIEDVAVVGKNCGIRGEIPVAFIITRNGENLSFADIKEFLNNKIANYKIPKKIIVIDDLPRNATGKVQKKILREQINQPTTEQ
ncbi:MAG: hypothetical protein DRI44_03625 [Chlamydiae bacterium]|nr:MAG: hypothetical protein DRI44_03625 [Chlamydiota bacterium]